MTAAPSSDLGAITTPGPGMNYLRPELHDMKIIGVEEHVIFPELTNRIPNEDLALHAKKVLSQLVSHDAMAYTKGRATNTGEQRLRDMNESGVATQSLVSLARSTVCRWQQSLGWR